MFFTSVLGLANSVRDTWTGEVRERYGGARGGEEEILLREDRANCSEGSSAGLGVRGTRAMLDSVSWTQGLVNCL